MVKIVQIICGTLIILSIFGLFAWFGTICLISIAALFGIAGLWLYVIEPIICKLKRRHYLTRI